MRVCGCVYVGLCVVCVGVCLRRCVCLCVGVRVCVYVLRVGAKLPLRWIWFMDLEWIDMAVDWDMQRLL